jgi:membrane protease YdiL (CAAX protease family)
MNHLESSFTGKNAVWRYLIMLAAVLAASNTIGAIPLFISIGMRSATDPQVFESLRANPNDLSILNLDPDIYLLEMLFPFFIGLAVFILLIRPLNNRTLKEVINGTTTFRWKRLFISALIWTVFAAVYLFASMKLDSSNYSLNNKSPTLISLIVISVFLIPFQAAWEEIIFRGYLLQGFAVMFRNRWFPIVMTSILFALMHILNPEIKEFGFWEMMPQYLLFGIIFGIITILDDGIEAAIGAHSANNVFLSIMLTNKGSVLQTPAIYEQHNYYPLSEFATMLVIGILVILVMKIVFRWNNFSALFGSVGKKPAADQVP